MLRELQRRLSALDGERKRIAREIETLREREAAALAAERHLRGEHTIGVYAIREDGGCVFLAADFDGEGWRAEVTAYRDAGRRCGVEVWVERSRSGEGAHAWIFFAEPVPTAE
jgi:hypothetical protein